MYFPWNPNSRLGEQSSIPVGIEEVGPSSYAGLGCSTTKGKYEGFGNTPNMPKDNIVHQVS